MYISMNRRLLAAMLIFTLLPALVKAEQNTESASFIIDVKEGHFLLDGTALPLAGGEKPISLGFRGGEALVDITTPEGIVRLSLGKAQVMLTESAAPFVREMKLKIEQVGAPKCAVCERSTAIGNHTMLPCGHFGCLKGADHIQICRDCKGFLCSGKNHRICEHCNKRWCVHIDIECEFTRNPIPTPLTTNTPDREMQHRWIEEDGSAAYGNPSGSGLRVEWNPGHDYMDAHATPVPRQ